MIERVIELYQQGLGTWEIARKFDVATYVIEKILIQQGIEFWRNDN